MISAEHPFRLDAGSLALDFLNTGSKALEPERADALAAPADLLAFLDAAGLGDPPGPLTPALRRPPGARILWSEARRLRSDLGEMLERLRTDGTAPPHLLYALNRVLDAGPIATVLALHEAGPRLGRRQAGEGPLAVLAPIALDAARLVTETDPDRIRCCDAEDCRRWFVDTSKGGQRRWCSMATCGNRAKAARHRKRTASSP